MSRPRFELRTFCVLDRCDNQLRHRPVIVTVSAWPPSDIDRKVSTAGAGSEKLNFEDSSYLDLAAEQTCKAKETYPCGMLYMLRFPAKPVYALDLHTILKSTRN